MRPSQEFSYERAQQKLVVLDFGKESRSNVDFRTPEDDIGNEIFEDQSEDIGLQGRLLRLAGLIDLGSRITVRKFKFLPQNVDWV